MTHIMVIAGTDSSGGAGLTRDVATAQALGWQVKPVVTAVTVQTDQAVGHVQMIPPDVVAAQIVAGCANARPRAVKIGMLGSAQTARAVVETLASVEVPIVLDPVLKASSGGALFDEDCFGPVMSLARIVTPNLIEASELTKSAVASTQTALQQQADHLKRLGARAILVKGGHGSGARCVDHLFEDGHHHRIDGARLNKNRRGTGCTLATAIACGLAGGATLEDACRTARGFVQCWISNAEGP